MNVNGIDVINTLLFNTQGLMTLTGVMGLGVLVALFWIIMRSNNLWALLAPGGMLAGFIFWFAMQAVYGSYEGFVGEGGLPPASLFLVMGESIAAAFFISIVIYALNLKYDIREKTINAIKEKEVSGD